MVLHQVTLTTAGIIIILGVACVAAQEPAQTCVGDDATCSGTEEQALLQHSSSAARVSPHSASAGLRPPAALSARDLARAKQVVPGASFLAAHAGETNQLLNEHLSRLAGGKARPCEDFTLAELEGLRREVRARSHPELQSIHAANRHPEKGSGWSDPRGSAHGAKLGEAGELALAQLSDEDARAVRSEKACYDIAMHFTHSLADADKKELLAGAAAGKRGVPLLPLRPSHETAAYLQQRAGGTWDLDNGESVFMANCAACHSGGMNAIVPEKKLTRAALEMYGVNTHGKVVSQVTNGKNAMPAFGDRLSDDDIQDAAAYVLRQSRVWD